MGAELEKAHFSEPLVVRLLGGADFDRLHHFTGGDDDAADMFWRGPRHGGVA